MVVAIRSVSALPSELPPSLVMRENGVTVLRHAPESDVSPRVELWAHPALSNAFEFALNRPPSWGSAAKFTEPPGGSAIAAATTKGFGLKCWISRFPRRAASCVDSRPRDPCDEYRHGAVFFFSAVFRRSRELTCCPFAAKNLAQARAELLGQGASTTQLQSGAVVAQASWV